MNVRITQVEAFDVRFPTSRDRHGSDAMNPDPDYSAAYAVVRTDVDGLTGHGLTFTIGRGNELCVAAVRSLAPSVLGLELEQVRTDLRGFWRRVTADSQLRWVGPEKGVIHMAAGALVNAVWDLLAKAEGKPLWRMVSEWSPQQIAAAIDFRGIEDALSEGEAVERLQEHALRRKQRLAQVVADGVQAYTTSTGWLGYDDERVRRLVRQAADDGWSLFKMKVGSDLEADVQRARLMRLAIGPDAGLMLDANQVWNVPQAIAAMRRLAEAEPLWIEEPTHPDDILGHAAIAREVAPIRVATGEMCANRVMFKQFLATGGMGVCQVDACRVGGVNEVLAVLLLADKAGVPVCPHAGGVGLSEYVQHIALIDAVAVAGPSEARMVEYVDHLHEHFLDPVRIVRGRYRPPSAPGYSIEMRPESLATFAFPLGRAWSDRDTPHHDATDLDAPDQDQEDPQP